MLAAGNGTIIERTIQEIALYLKATKPLEEHVKKHHEAKTTRRK